MGEAGEGAAQEGSSEDKEDLQQLEDSQRLVAEQEATKTMQDEKEGELSN